MPKYRVNGDIYNIPEEKVSAFEKRYPNATVDIYDNDGAEYSLPVSEKVNFQKQFKNWSYTAPAAHSAPSAEEINSGSAGPVMPKPAMENRNWEVQMGNGHSRATVEKPEPVDVPIPQRPERQEPSDDGTAAPSGDVRSYLENANRQQVANLSRDINSRLDEAQTKSRDIYMKEQEDARKGGFLSTLAHAIAASGHNPEGGSGGMSDAQQRTLQGANSELQSEISKLEAAKKAMSNAEEIIAEADKSVQEGKFPGFFKGVARGFGDKLFDVNTWDMGVSDTKNSIELLKALRKYDEGKPLSESEQMLLDAKSVELATNAYFGSYIGRGYKAGAVTAQSLPFMLEMAVNPASTLGESTQSMLARYALSRFAKKGATRAAQKFATKAAGAAGRALGDIAGSAVMAGTSGAVRVAGDAIDRHVGDIETDMDGQGQTVFAGHDPESLGKSIAKAFTSTAIENHSEMLGEYFAPALGIVSKLGRKGMEKFGLKNVVDFVDDVSATDAAKLIADFQKRTKWHGTIGEYAEEVVGNIENAILVGDSTLNSSDDTGVFNLDQNIDTFLGVALMGGVFSTIRTAAWRTPKYRARKEMEKARAKAKKKFGDQEWQDIEDRLAEAGDEGMSSVLSEVIIGERNPEREKAILDYAKSIKIYEGTLKGDEKHRELSSPEMTDLESSYENGYTLATPQEVHDAKIMFEYQQARLQQALGMSSIDIETLMLGNEMGKLTEEQKSVALDYLNAEATFDGVIDRVRDDIDNRISSVNAAIDASTNSDTGKLQPARLVDDRAVHIISGIVRLTPDGTMVDIHNSEDYIIIRDDKTGKIESVSPSQIVGVDAEIEPESEKKASESQIRGQIGQQKADIIDGVLQFSPGDVYTLTNEQGQSFTVQVTADEQGVVDNGDGTINVILNEDIDANTGLPRISQMSKEQIENMAEATNMARLQQYEQQKLDVDARQYEEDSTGRTPENPFKINDRISFNDVGSGSVKHGIVESELTDDGKYEIAIENDGSIESVSYLSPEDLSNMQAQLVQSVEEQEAPEIEQNPAEIEQPEQPQVSAFERIPKDEQGNPIYEQAETPELAWDAIVEQTDGDEAMAQTVTDGMVADKETALKKVEKAKSKGGATIAEKIASEKERKAAIEEAKANLAVWKQIAQTARRRKDAEESEKRRIAEEQAAIRKAEEEKLRAEREEAERIKREALNGVPDISDDTPQDARARGYRRVSGHKVDRQEPIPHLQGNDIAVKFSDDVIVPGRVAVIEAETLQPSHIQGTRNPAHFIDESQPKERTDDASVLSARKIARNIRPEEITSSVTAYTGAPTTNVRGEVIQGNNRSDALRLIWEGDKEQSAIYKQYLMDHAADFGLNADEISAMNHPVLVNMLDVDDATAITLGQFVAQDTESGGTERIKPKNAVQKMGADMRTFADMLLASSDDETSFAGLVDRNGDEVLAWMNRRGFITPTQYKSAFDSKGGITAEAKNDLKGIMYQSIFTGGNIRLEEMFNAMPAKAQRAILATAFRDNESPNTERMVKEIQNSIRAYNALSQGEDFANAKNWKEARLAVESWKMQYAMDDVTGESYLPAEKFSNFALHLATMYKGESQSLIQSTFNHLYDLIQGTQEETLFEKPDNTPRTLAQAILETLNFEYDGQQRSNVLAGDSTASQEREQGSTGTPAAGERVEGGEQPADNTGGTENESGSGEVREKIAEEGSKVNTNPSDAQKEAGNYRMGHVKIDGMDVTIENPKGSIRKGRDADGKEWQSEMHNDYGYIRGTKAVDNDHIDIFLSDDPEHGNVYVIDQVDPKTGKFDESKVMYGFSSEQEARDAYLSNYEEGWKGLGKITEVTKEEFKKWIDSSTRKTKPFSEYASVKAAKPQKEKPVQGIEGYSRDEIKGIVADHINDVMRDNDIHAEIIGMDIHGSRNRHDARPDSDLDVVVEYRGDVREDDMFNALNGEEDARSINGIKVDINPIRKEETGDLQGYMKQSEEYDREKSEHAKQKGSSTTSEIKNNKSGKIEDYGEQISGARKDMLRDLAKSVQNTSLESLISLPFSKAFKKPNLRKAVEEGALRDKDARFAQAAIAAFLSTKKPVAGTKDERRRQRWGEKTNVEKWAEKAYTGIKMLQELFDADERVRDNVIEAAVADKYVGVDEAKAQQQRIGGLNHREFKGTSYPLNLIALYNEVFDRLGYPAGQNTKIPVGRIVCSSTFDSYSLRGVNGEDWIYPSRSLKSFEDVVDELVYLIKVANADETADHPIENFKIRGINPKVETTGYRVLAAKNLTTAITRGNRFAVDEIFPTREAALKRIEELKAKGLECSEPLEKRETVGYEKYQISFAHPITREFIPLEKEYGSKEEAIAAPEAEHEELNRLANEAIAAATKKSGESVEKSYFHITHYYDKGSDGKYHWYYGVALDDKYGPKKTAFNTMPFFLAERLNSREEAQKQIDANKERWESLVKDVVRQRSNFVYFSGDNETRNGEDYRNGKDVTAEEFANKFGFRGVQFGNWANQADRQAALNNAYDSFMDMSKIIGVSPKAMSLNGELGVAFGSRGSGAASAHYEPGEVVINLTKTRGAGSLAHEWWHALDNYFSRAANVKLGYVTSDKRLPMREEMRKAFNELVDDVEKSDYHTRSMDRGSGYWGTRVEETARLFAEWIADEMAKRGELNNFLAGRNDSEDSYARMGYVFYKAIQKLKPEGEMMTFEEFRKTPMALKGFSYPTRAELEILGKDVRNIFGVVQERTDETTGNVALFQMVDKILSDNSPENRLAYETVSQMLSNAGIPVELLSDQAMREMAINATMLDTVLPEDESSFKGTVISSIDGAKILNNLDKAIDRYNENPDNRPWTFIGDLASALGSSDKDKSSQYATFETKNGQVVTIRVSNHNATVSNFDNAGESNGISIVISRKPNEGMTNDGDAHIVEFFYPDKALNKAEGKPLVEILKSIKQSLYSGEYKDTTGLAQREEVNAKESVEFLREPDGTVYGATVGGKIYLNRERLNPNTPIHEYTHLWFSALKDANPELYKRGVELMKQLPIWEEVKTDPNYAELSGDDAIASECLSRLVGDRGADKLTELAKKAMVRGDIIGTANRISLIEDFKDWLKKFWTWVRDSFAPWTKEETSRVSVDDIQNMVLSDLAKGVNPLAKYNAMDKEYFEALSDNDIEKAQRLVAEAAAAAGYSKKVFRVDNRDYSMYPTLDKNRYESVNGGVFYADDIDYFKASDTGYSAKDAKSFFMNPDGFFDPLSEMKDVVVNGWSDILGRRSDFERFDIEDESEGDRGKYRNGEEICQTSTDGLALAGQRLGYDGVVLKDIPTNTSKTYSEYAVFNSNSVKSAEPVVYDDNGDVIPLSQRFNIGDADIRFSIAKGNSVESDSSNESETDRIVRESKENGTYMKAPNGKPTNLNERQWAQVRTRAFKKWFGDWEKAAEESPSTAKTNSSKIVDENGEPKVVYHGSPYRFFRFDKTKLGQSTGADSAKEGFFFTDNKELAELFSRYSLESLPVSDVEQLVKDRLLNMSENELNDAYEVYRNDSPDYLDYADETDSPNDRDYLEIRGFLLDGVSEEEAKREYIQDSIESKIEGGYFSDMEEVEEELSSIGIEFGNNEQVFLNIESPLVDEVERDYFHNGEDVSPMTPVLQNAKRMGSDGVVFTGIVESGQKGAANQYVAFEPNQIKSATDNVGTFDVGQEDIRYRDSGQMDAEYMSAIESGDMRKAGRMVEAAFRKAFPGSKVKNVVYHGVAVSEDGRQFPYNSIRDGHFTDDEGFAEYYAGSDGYVYKVFLDIESPLEQDFRGQNSDFARDAEGNDVSTRTFARRAKDSNGRYDGAIITNVDEYGDGIEADGVGNYDGSVTDYIPVSADQIYSAEPVVYDDNGQVIPLSRRFENGNSDIRYKHDETGNGNRTSQDIEAAATKLAESLGEKVRIVRDVNEIEHQNKKVQDNQRKSKGWFNTDTREIVVVLPNATGIEDVQATILHEAVGHKGLRELVGDDRFDDFLDKVYAAATKATRLEIVSLARRNHWDFRLATEEYIAGLAENGFAGRENRTLFEKIKDFFRDMLSRAKIALGVNIGDNELRYMLWRTYQMRTSRGILAKAEDISMQQSMKVGNFRNEVPEESSRLRFRNSSNGSRKSLARDIYEEKTRIVDRKGQKTDTANLMRRLKEAYVDSMQSLKYLQDAISEETGKPVEDFENAYLAENSMSSKNKAQTDIYLNRFFNPIKDAIRDLQKEGAEYGDIVRYLMAKHGLERNEVFSKRDAEKDGGVWDGSVRRDYSGLTELTRRETDTVAPRIDEITSRAEDIVRKFEMDHDTDVLWEKINDATKDTLRTSYITGMLTRDNYEMVRSMFRYYIPLRGWSENTASAVYDYLSDARPKTSSIVKAATGRTTISDDPIATIAYMGQSAIIQGNRNMMKQKLLNLALNHKTGLLTVNRQWEVQDPVTGEWITRNPVIPVDATPEEVADIVSQFETDMKAAEKNGTARISRGKLDTGKHITAYEGQEHVVKVKRGGIEYCIYLNGNPRAAQAVNGMTNPDAVDSWLIRKARVIKNFMARMFTSQNPAFIISNLSRDVIFAGTAVFAKEDSKYTALYTKNIARALAKGQLIGLVHRFETGRLDDSKDIDRYFGEFIRNGGETGFTQLNTVDDFKRDLNRFAKEMRQGQVMKVSSKVWNGIWDGVEFMNRCAEDATRFSVYMTSRQMGRSVERSISDAKEITVNFNRKGSGGFGARVMNFAYIFFNAAIQALANAGKIFYEHPVKSAVALSTFSAAGFLAPLLAQAIISAFGGDDDAYWDLPEWVRRNNFVFYVPWSDNKFLIIPISQELRPFYALGEVAMSVLMGKEDVLEGLRSVGGSFMDLLPVDFMGNGNNLAVSFTPTVAQPFAQLVANSDYFGKPIYRRNDYNRLDPAWTKAYKGTSSMLINASKWLNEVTGGDDVKRGWIDPVNNPAVIEHLFESYLGGVGKTINKTAKTISMIWNPEMRDIRNVPIVSTFVQESDDERVAGSQLNREYVKAMEEFRETEHTISGYKRKARMGSMEYADKLSDFMNTPEFKKYSKMKGYASSIAKLRTALKKTEELNGDVMDAEYLQEMLRELKQQMLEELKED